MHEKALEHPSQNHFAGKIKHRPSNPSFISSLEMNSCYLKKILNITEYMNFVFKVNTINTQIADKLI